MTTQPNERRPVSALQRFAQRATQTEAPSPERCTFCSEPLPEAHRHLAEVSTRAIRCVCQACSLLFDKQAASEGRYRLIPDRRLFLENFPMSDAQWDNLRIPVGMAFFFHSTPAERMLAFYPGPMGPTESLLALDAWEEIAAHSPALQTLQPDVEALLVNRTRGAAQHFLVPIDDCYRLVGLIRLHWKGLSGGQEAWNEIAQFFDTLRARSKTMTQGDSP